MPRKKNSDGGEGKDKPEPEKNPMPGHKRGDKIQARRLFGLDGVREATGGNAGRSPEARGGGQTGDQVKPRRPLKGQLSRKPPVKSENPSSKNPGRGLRKNKKRN